MSYHQPCPSNGTAPTSLPAPRIIAHVVSDHVKNNPHKVWGASPRSRTDPAEGYEDISFARLNYAISRAAQWMQETIEPHRDKEHEALAYIGEPDTRYIVLAIAALKVGFQMLFLSPRNSNEAQRTVIEQATCTKFLYTHAMAARVEKILQSHARLRSMAKFEVPGQDELLRDEEVADFPYERTIEEVRALPLVSLHTSSTTGMPKIVRLTQGYGFHEDLVQHVPEYEGLDIITRKPFYGAHRMFVAMPLFHTGGILLTLLKSIYHDIVCIFQPPSAALDAHLFDGILRHGQCTGCVIPPYLLEEMLAVPNHFDTLASLKFVQFGSGPLSKAAGDLLLTRQNDCPHYIGSSECGLYILLELDDPVKDWQYFRFHPLSGVEMRPIGGDSTGTFELVVVRSAAQKHTPGLQPVFELLPDLNEWPTNDLYIRHPFKPDHWRYMGRNDDVLVLSNGEKLNPVDIEARIANAHSAITGALVVGQGQFAPGLLLEARGVDASDASARAQLIEAIWPAVEAANRESPGHGQLSRGLVIFTDVQKPFLRTPKLSVRRGPTVDLYAGEITEMYQRYALVGEGNEAAASQGVDFSSLNGIQRYLESVLRAVTAWEGDLRPDEDLFQNGMDSLQVLRIARTVSREMQRRKLGVEVDVRALYSHPTLKGLAEAVLDRMASAKGVGGGGDEAASDERREHLIDQFVREHTAFMPSLANLQRQKGHLRNVVLTGSTGSLGSRILLALLADPQVGSIYCINRSPDAKARQLAMGLPDVNDRVHFLYSTSLAAPYLGLPNEEALHQLRLAQISHIIHNAWPVNFNLSLQSFSPHLSGVRALVEFSASLPSPAKIIFVSSLSSVTSLSLASDSSVPEHIILEPSAPAKMGYGESKYVAERILHRATEESDGALETAVVRIGQIAGPVKRSTAVWPTREWLPSLVISSKTVGALPEELGRMDDVDWVPVDLVADCVVDLLAGPGDGDGERVRTEVFHLINPDIVSWSSLVPSIAAQIEVRRMVTLAEWIELVRQGPDETAESNSNPAKKILPFYRALQAPKRSSRYETARMAQTSETYRALQAITSEQMGEWISKWR
ncbi:hypothetical protein BDY17DRAFT_326254 [Neohortaea acidophila]|uniref:Carrier domain-containing protein n=1 Tax=Neohortaea acidophila TaxID=245834 RepID=A0A6A6PQ55_9PEZI|nr:uncharacterized protein BDY17DRAFT_326254 [Neohortaea acidophila]KAF2481573.1 hypothetical protein BDY17DRAFT_326254 [Neohortaea acidophila]